MLWNVVSPVAIDRIGLHVVPAFLTTTRREECGIIGWICTCSVGWQTVQRAAYRP